MRIMYMEYYTDGVEIFLISIVKVGMESFSIPTFLIHLATLLTCEFNIITSHVTHSIQDCWGGLNIAFKVIAFSAMSRLRMHFVSKILQLGCYSASHSN